MGKRITVPLLTALGVILAAGYIVLRGGEEVVDWDTCCGSPFPLETIGVAVRIEFHKDVEIGGSLEVEPNFRTMIDKDAWDDAVIFIAPINPDSTIGPWGREVLYKTGERLHRRHYDEPDSLYWLDPHREAP